MRFCNSSRFAIFSLFRSFLPSLYLSPLNLCFYEWRKKKCCRFVFVYLFIILSSALISLKTTDLTDQRQIYIFHNKIINAAACVHVRYTHRKFTRFDSTRFAPISALSCWKLVSIMHNNAKENVDLGWGWNEPRIRRRNAFISESHTISGHGIRSTARQSLEKY